MDWKQCFKGKKILLAEDDEIIQEMMGEVLQNMGIEMTLAKDGNEAVKKFQEGPFDLILMDILMPNKNGIEAICEIRELEKVGKPVPIIVVTASMNFMKKETILAIGANALLFKPVSLEELRNIMYKHLYS